MIFRFDKLFYKSIGVFLILVFIGCKGQSNEVIKTDTLDMYDKNIDKRAYYLNYDLF